VCNIDGVFFFVFLLLLVSDVLSGKFHDQGDAKWIVIREQLRGHNDMPFGRPPPDRPSARRGVGRPQGVFGVFSYYQLVISSFQHRPPEHGIQLSAFARGHPFLSRAV
jgi:hypothetical protein